MFSFSGDTRRTFICQELSITNLLHMLLSVQINMLFICILRGFTIHRVKMVSFYVFNCIERKDDCFVSTAKLRGWPVLNFCGSLYTLNPTCTSSKANTLLSEDLIGVGQGASWHIFSEKRQGAPSKPVNHLLSNQQAFQG